MEQEANMEHRLQSSQRKGPPMNSCKYVALLSCNFNLQWVKGECEKCLHKQEVLNFLPSSLSRIINPSPLKRTSFSGKMPITRHFLNNVVNYFFLGPLGKPPCWKRKWGSNILYLEMGKCTLHVFKKLRKHITVTANLQSDLSIAEHYSHQLSRESRKLSRYRGLTALLSVCYHNFEYQN